MRLWNNGNELEFFRKALENHTPPEKLFYKLGTEYYAYIPKNYNTQGQTLQSRNSLIGQFTEKWTRNIIDPIAKENRLYALNNVECEEIGLSKNSKADLALCSTNSTNQTANNIKLIFEIKMSIVSNYKYTAPNHITLLGDYKTHKGIPSLLRFDSMLKAIGKSINIKVSSIKAAKIPVIILGNSPIKKSYEHKVDFLKTTGVVQGFWSLNPDIFNGKEYIEKTTGSGFLTIKNHYILQKCIKELLRNEMNYFSSMLPKSKLGEYIYAANKENSNDKKAEKFLKSIRSTQCKNTE
ncbi:MAG: hypothetical protein LBL71_02375 [Endomicrobium sp.]|jgi:hypothetical protein|nr:hypothetical protein [Endomicrobium sp.]